MSRHRMLVSTLAIWAAAAPLAAQGVGSGDPWAGTPQQRFYESAIVDKYQCDTCHTITSRGGTVGPILNHVGHRRSREWIERWLADPNAVKPGTKMPKFPFTPEEREAATEYLTALRPARNVDAILAGAGSAAEKGEALFREYDCYACHRVGAEGRFVGPDLTWLGRRKTREWERVWLKDPDAWKPGTFMPNFDLGPDGIEALTAHLETLDGQRNRESQEWEFNVNLFLNNRAARRGELVFKRAACWSCHGEDGRGGIRNPNAAPDEQVPSLLEATNTHSLEQLQTRLAERQRPASIDSSAAAAPFFCPDYSGALTDDELADLYAYLVTLAPKKQRFSFR